MRQSFWISFESVLLLFPLPPFVASILKLNFTLHQKRVWIGSDAVAAKTVREHQFGRQQFFSLFANFVSQFYLHKHIAMPIVASDDNKLKFSSENKMIKETTIKPKNLSKLNKNMALRLRLWTFIVGTWYENEIFPLHCFCRKTKIIDQRLTKRCRKFRDSLTIIEFFVYNFITE